MASPLEWKGLLKWSLQHHDGTAPSEVSEMSQENKKWLEEVMASLVLDESKRILEIISSLVELAEDVETDVGERDEERLEDLFDELEDIVCQIDYANFFVKLKGLDALTKLSSSPWDLMRERALSIVGAVTQNNPEAQGAAVAHPGFLSGIAERIEVDSQARVRAAALAALSSVATNFKPGVDRFYALGGPAILIRLLEDDEADPTCFVRRKAAFAAKKLFSLEGLTEEQRRALAPLVPRLVRCLRTQDADLREKALAALVEYTAMDTPDLAALQEQEEALTTIRAQRVQQMDAEDAENADDADDAFNDLERSLWGSLLAALERIRGGQGQDPTATARAPTTTDSRNEEVFMIGPPPENVPQ